MSPLVLCSLTIIVTLVASGIAKAKDLASTAAAIVNLDLDRWLPMKAVSKFLPWGEIALAVWILVIPGWLGILGGIAAIILFVAYFAVIFRAVYSGNTASCNCFGGASTAPISLFTLLRNTALVGAAVGTLLATVTTGRSVIGQLLQLDGAGWLWLLGAGFVALALWSMYRSELVEAPHTEESEPVALAQPEPADEEDLEYVRLPIPFAVLHDPVTKQTQSLRDLSSHQARVLFWVSPGCAPCRQVIEKIEGWQEKLPMLKLNPVVSSEPQVAQLGLSPQTEIFVDPEYATEHMFGSGTPLAVALGADGLVAGGPVVGSNRVEEFIEDIMAEFGVE